MVRWHVGVPMYGINNINTSFFFFFFFLVIIVVVSSHQLFNIDIYYYINHQLLASSLPWQIYQLNLYSSLWVT